MTHEELEALPLRELDALVAEKVMGLAVIRPPFVRVVETYSADDNAVRLVRNRIAALGVEMIRRYEVNLAQFAWPEQKLRQSFSCTGHFAFGMQQATPKQQCVAALLAVEEAPGRETKG